MGLHSASPGKKGKTLLNSKHPKRPSRPPGVLNSTGEAPLQQARPRVARRRRFVPPTASPMALRMLNYPTMSNKYPPVHKTDPCRNNSMGIIQHNLHITSCTYNGIAV